MSNCWRLLILCGNDVCLCYVIKIYWNQMHIPWRIKRNFVASSWFWSSYLNSLIDSLCVTCSSSSRSTRRDFPRSRCSARSGRERASSRTVCRPRSCTFWTWCCRGWGWSQRWGKTVRETPGCSIRWVGRWKGNSPPRTWRKDNDQRGRAASREQMREQPQLREKERECMLWMKQLAL